MTRPIKILITFGITGITAYELVTAGPAWALPFAILTVVVAALFWPGAKVDE